MLDQLQASDAAALIGSSFEVLDDVDHPFSLTLVNVADLLNTEQNRTFSLFFKGAAERFMPQGTHTLRHGELGVFEIFLVPVGRTKEQVEYEAVFNHILK